MSESVRVNFAREMPLFPLPETVLLPHAVLPLHIFEPRYRRMVNDCLDQAGQIAMGTFEWRRHGGADDQPPTIRPAVCVGQIVQHEALPDGRHNILLHGVCRARIAQVAESAEKRNYRTAMLSPIEIPTNGTPGMEDIRNEFRELLTGPRLRRLRSAETVLQWFERQDVPTAVLLELIGSTLIHDADVKYRLLAEGDPCRRAAIIRCELRDLDHLVQRADGQSQSTWPKGMSWN